MTDTSFKAAVGQVKLAYDIVEYISANGVRLKQQGGKWKGLCPFHNEKSPSFVVDSHFQNYKCWGCGVSGDLISYVERTEALEFFDALKKLAEDKNIELAISDSREAGVDYKSLREVLKETANFFFTEYRKLAEDHPARKEVADRGLSDKKFLYGYAPEGRQTLYKHLSAKGFTDEVMLQAGVCVQFEKQTQAGLFDFWHGRLMFFITDVTGKPIGFSGRKLYETDKRGKYVNSKDGPLFDKSSVLFHIDKAKKKVAETKLVYVNEGQFDVAAMAASGAENSVASSGTAFTERQGMILRRLVGEDGKIVFCFDGDSAGVKAAQRVFQAIPAIHGQAYVVSLPEGMDPCDYRLKHGGEALLAFLAAEEKPLVEFVLDQAAKLYEVNSTVDGAKYVEAAARILKTLSSNVLRATYTKKVSLDSFTSIEVVKQAVDAATALTPDTATSSAEVSAPEPARYVDEEESKQLSLGEILELIEQDEVYDLSARLVALALQEHSLVEPAHEQKNRFPEVFHVVVDELKNLPPGSPIISEAFTFTELAEVLITRNFFPFGHLFDEQRRTDHFTYLLKRLTEVEDYRREKNVRSKVAQVLQKSPAASAKFLEKALQAEARGLSELEEVSR